MADAGYGSEENYAYLEAEGVDAYVKHGEFFRECHNRKWREDEMRVANWEYDEESDEHTCPEGKTLVFLKESSRVSELGYESVVRVYECESCSGCPRKAKCSKSASPDTPKRIQVNPALNAFRRRASEMLHTEIGSALRKEEALRRCGDRVRRHQEKSRVHEVHAQGPREGDARVEAGRHGTQHTEALSRGIQKEKGDGGGCGAGTPLLPAPSRQAVTS